MCHKGDLVKKVKRMRKKGHEKSQMHHLRLHKQISKNVPKTQVIGEVHSSHGHSKILVIHGHLRAALVTSSRGGTWGREKKKKSKITHTDT